MVSWPSESLTHLLHLAVAPKKPSRGFFPLVILLFLLFWPLVSSQEVFSIDSLSNPQINCEIPSSPLTFSNYCEFSTLCPSNTKHFFFHWVGKLQIFLRITINHQNSRFTLFPSPLLSFVLLVGYCTFRTNTIDHLHLRLTLCLFPLVSSSSLFAGSWNSPSVCERLNGRLTTGNLVEPPTAATPATYSVCLFTVACESSSRTNEPT